MNEAELKILENYTKINFLILEDEEDVGEVTEGCLRDFGFSGSIVRVCSIEEAAIALNDESTPIEFIISDWNLKELSGLDFLIMTREIPKYKATPFLMVTANDNVSGMLVATKRGATDYLVKPWNPDELREKLYNCLTS